MASLNKGQAETVLESAFISRGCRESVGWRGKGVNSACLVSYFLYSLYSLFSDDKGALCGYSSKGIDES